MPDTYSDKQLRAILEMNDIGAQEQQLAQQQAMVNQLRQSAPQGKDWGSQLSQAMGGLAQGYAMSKMPAQYAGITASRKKTLADLFGSGAYDTGGASLPGSFNPEN